MATISEQISLLKEQLQLSQQADNSRHILDEYEAIRTSIFKVNDSLKTMYSKSRTLQGLPEGGHQKMEFSEDVRETAKSGLFALQTFTARWESEGYKARQGNDLTLMTESLKSLVTSGTEQVEHCWKGWVESLEVALEDVRLESQKNIPGLESTHAAFIKARIQFRELVAKFPEGAEDIERLQRLSTIMQQLKEKMQFDLPEEVAIFFRQLDSMSRKVSLGAMTPGVFEWLRLHNLLDAYVVSRKVRY
jgi:hypothetical protein